MLALEGLPTEDEIRALVEAFYARVREDAALSPIFSARITEWDAHLDRMTAFWSNVLLSRVGYRGDPIGKHRGMSELEPRHFDRWLELFAEVANEVLDPAVAANVHGRAVRMRVVLERP